MLLLSTMQRHGSHHSLNAHDIYRENVRQTSHWTWRVGVKCTGHAGGIGLFFRGGRIVDAVCGERQWSLVRVALDYLTCLQEICTSTRHTHAFADNGVHLFNTDALIIISRTSIDRRLSQTAHLSWAKNLPIASWRRPTRAKCWNGAAAVKMH